jgi:hypothetical protein
MSVSESIIIGVVTGIITTSILFILKIIFEKIILPWYHQILYEGIIVDGKWSTADGTILLKLSQKAHKITGNLINQESNYTISGTIWEGYLRLNSESTDKTKLSYLNMLVKVSGTGKKMIGSFNYRDLEEDLVKNSSITFDRKLQ